MKKIGKVNLASKEIFPIGIGTWQIGDHAMNRENEIEAIQQGLSQGIQLIDTAEMYGDGKAEELVGEAIKNKKREDLFVVSKVLPKNANRKKLLESLDKSLQRLKINELDLYLLHWKSDIPLAETVASLEEVKKVRKIRAWGVSNFDTADMEELLALPQGKNCATNQIKYNIIDRGAEFDLLPYLQENQITTMAYSPMIKGQWQQLTEEQRVVLLKISDDQEISVGQIMLAWAIREGSTIAIPKAGSPQHIRENVASATKKLTAEELILIDSVFQAPTKKTDLALW
ncbi:aldo/keto reductase [Enterococcus alishanensis]